jgi:two-component system, OmpR family, sensor kinase
MKAAAAARPRQRRMALRIYLFGVLLLVLSGLAIAVVGRIFVAPAMRNPDRTMSPWLVSHLAPYRADPARMRQELEQLRRGINLRLTFYDASGELLASSAEPPDPPIDAGRLGAFEREDVFYVDGEQRHGLHAVAIREEGALVGYALVKPPFGGGPPAPPLSSAAIVLGVVLVLLGVLSLPLARSMVAPLERLGEAARAFGAGDVSARAKVDRADEIGDLARTFDEMADRVTALLRAEKELVANVSHELRTPLARIRVVLELAGEVDPARVRRYLGEIAEDLAELERLVDDVLAMARLDVATAKPGEAGALALHLSPTGPEEVVEEAAKRFQSRFPARELVTDVALGLPTIDVDAALLRRVVDNLLDNARKYSEDATRIDLTARREAGGVVFEVKDRGIGIEASDVPLVFRPFFRSDRSRARRTGGVGLGLALARRIVEAHGGRIEIESEVGVGTTARFFVPGEDAEGIA